MNDLVRRRILALLKAAFTLTLLAVLYRRIDRAALGEKLASIQWAWVGLFWLILVLNTIISTLKWRILLVADGIRQSFGNLLYSYWIGSFFNVFLPSTIGGDAYRIADVGRRSEHTARTAASVVVDRLAGFLALAVFGLGLFPLFRRTYEADPRLILLPLATLGGLVAAGAVLWDGKWLRFAISRLPASLAERVGKVSDTILGSIRVYAARKRYLAQVFAFSLLFQALAITAVWSLGRATGLDLPLPAFGFFVPFITLMEMIPVSIFGIGLRDTGYVWFMYAVGRSDADAAALSVLYVAATIAYVSMGGLIYLGRTIADRGRG